jgi:hypothetical protein
MPAPLNLQTVVAFVWDFDKTLTPSYMQTPLFENYGVDQKAFWKEVNGLVDHYRDRGLQVSRDTAYLGHILAYVRAGKFPDLTNEKLREFGALIPLAPGMPNFIERTHDRIRSDERFQRHRITVEHYIVSTGLRQMIEGSPIREHVNGVWACELLSDPAGPGYLGRDTECDSLTGELTQVGYVLDNTTKTRAIFEINKGVNHDPGIDVNARMAEDDRRVPISNMIYIADGPSDVPVFSVVNQQGGRTFAVYTLGPPSNFDGVKRLQDDGRVQGIAQADYQVGTTADLWLMSSMVEIANDICERRERRLSDITGPAGHVV